MLVQGAQLVAAKQVNSNSDNETLSFSMANGGVMVTGYADEARVTTANIQACDSIVHIIDHVLLPNFAVEGLVRCSPCLPACSLARLLACLPACWLARLLAGLLACCLLGPCFCPSGRLATAANVFVAQQPHSSKVLACLPPHEPSSAVQPASI